MRIDQRIVAISRLAQGLGNRPSGGSILGKIVITRWDEWFSEENLCQDERILTAPPSQCAATAALEFLSREKRLILDVACGVGRDTFHLESKELAVVGVDASLNGLRAAKRVGSERGARSELINADARRLPFRDASFEGAYCFGLLHEFTGEHKEEDVAGVIGEIRRVLSDEGILVLTALAGEPEEGLPAVQMFTRQMFAHATRDLQAPAIKMFTDVGCTGCDRYSVWYGLFEK